MNCPTPAVYARADARDPAATATGIGIGIGLIVLGHVPTLQDLTGVALVIAGNVGEDLGYTGAGLGR